MTEHDRDTDVERTGTSETSTGTPSETRSIAQLNMLHTLAARLGALTDVEAIGRAITAELGTIIDYHNCRIYLIEPDGYHLNPVAFQGKLGEYEDETPEELRSVVGEGLTGRVAALGESFYAPNAMDVEWAVTIEGTDDIDESMLLVPMKYGDRVIGVIVLSSLGVDLFDDEDMRLLEVLAPHAAAAYENARLLQLERDAAETSAALLRLSTSLTQVHDSSAALQKVVDAVPDMLPCSVALAYLRDPDSGDFRMAAIRAADPELHVIDSAEAAPVPAGFAASLFQSLSQPFVIGADVARQVPREFWVTDNVVPAEALIAPFRWDPDGFGALSILAPSPEDSFSDADRRMAQGIADISSLALGTASRFHELERFHDLVEGLDAVFWEADPGTLQFTFLSSRAGETLGPEMARWETVSRYWGEHIRSEDRDQAIASLRAAAAARTGGSLEYRSAGLSDDPVWLRDQVGIVRTPDGGVSLLRGLIVDITERKRAEQALRNSERKYSEAFEREREAAGRLRALDEMKNTFLEAVSHDLRTPLTSILGSAITLEQTGLDLPHADALDLVGRIAANARKLERLLADLLNLDRLQRGIVAPQRRPTDVGALARLACSQAELLGDRDIELSVEPIIASVDAAKVERIVENLLANAVRHTPSHAHLWVRVRRDRDGVLIVVEDDGPGVPEPLREAIFEPFRQLPGASDHSPGVGIGLSLVARFAELHGGRAWVQEREGGGASFRVLLPDGEPEADRRGA